MEVVEVVDEVVAMVDMGVDAEVVVVVDELQDANTTEITMMKSLCWHLHPRNNLQAGH